MKGALLLYEDKNCVRIILINFEECAVKKRLNHYFACYVSIQDGNPSVGDVGFDCVLDADPSAIIPAIKQGLVDQGVVDPTIISITYMGQREVEIDDNQSESNELPAT